MDGEKKASTLTCHLPPLLSSSMLLAPASQRGTHHSKKLSHRCLLLGFPRTRSSPLIPPSEYATHVDRAYPIGLPCAVGALKRFPMALPTRKVRARYATEFNIRVQPMP